MELTPIGWIRSPYREHAGTPVQPPFGDQATEIEIDETYRDALADLDGFDWIWVITWLDRAKPWRPLVVPYRDTVERGLFATRAPSRPNPIGLSCVRLLSIDFESGILHLESADFLDGTPVLDLKPYIPRVDAFPDAGAGWFDVSETAREEADGRFEEPGAEPAG